MNERMSDGLFHTPLLFGLAKTAISKKAPLSTRLCLEGWIYGDFGLLFPPSSIYYQNIKADGIQLTFHNKC